MDVIASPTQRASMDHRRHNRVIMVLAGLIALIVAFIGLSMATGHLQFRTNATTTAAATQDCKKPGKNVGDLCATVNTEYGTTVTRTFKTLQYSNGPLYATEIGKSVQLNEGDAATVDTLCIAATVGSLTPDHSDFTREYALVNKEYCNHAREALADGNADLCSRTLNDASGLAPLALNSSNIYDACAVPAQPKGKSALVDTKSILNDTPWYNPSKIKRDAS